MFMLSICCVILGVDVFYVRENTNATGLTWVISEADREVVVTDTSL